MAGHFLATTPNTLLLFAGCIHSDLRRHELIPDPLWSANELDIQWIEEHDWTCKVHDFS